MTLEQLYLQYFTPLFRWAYSKIHDSESAKDCVQSAFCKLMCAKTVPDDPVLYLKKVLYNNILMSLNRDKMLSRNTTSVQYHFEHVLEEGEAPDHDRLFYSVTSARIGMIRKYIRRMPASKKKDCMRLRYIRGLGICEISETLGVSKNTVKTHIKIGLRDLKERLKYVHINLV